LNNKLVTSTITGSRTEAHWDSYIDALNVTLSTEDEAFINDLVTAGHASTHRFTDPGHPVEGRVPLGQ
jgi:aryl-alcohol dehydrogenase-like predicted oxidoreductase